MNFWNIQDILPKKEKEYQETEIITQNMQQSDKYHSISLNTFMKICIILHFQQGN